MQRLYLGLDKLHIQQGYIHLYVTQRLQEQSKTIMIQACYRLRYFCKTYSRNHKNKQKGYTERYLCASVHNTHSFRKKIYMFQVYSPLPLLIAESIILNETDLNIQKQYHTVVNKVHNIHFYFDKHPSI